MQTYLTQAKSVIQKLYLDPPVKPADATEAS